MCYLQKLQGVSEIVVFLKEVPNRGRKTIFINQPGLQRSFIFQDKMIVKSNTKNFETGRVVL